MMKTIKNIGGKKIKMVKKIKNKAQELKREIEIPKGIEVEIINKEMIAKKEGKEIKRKLPKVIAEKKDNKIIIKTKRGTKRERKQINTIVAHINNVFKGLNEKFVYKLQICSVHFPMNVSVKDDEVVVKNFLGETKERKAKILPDVEVKIEKEIITIDSINKEAAGQTAGNIEKATKVKGRDRRIYQDGIFMLEKSGRKI